MKGGYHLLLVQDICLSWGKKERGSVYAKMRAEFPIAYLLDKPFDRLDGDVFVHHLKFWQKRTMFQTLYLKEGYRFQFYPSAQEVNLTNLSIESEIESYKVIFFYDEHRSGQPIRRGHNKDYHNVDSLLYRHDILNETAFSLELGQYGRVVWNERNMDYDTGEWYYQLHIINLLHYPNEIPKKDIFLSHKLDFAYKQMAVLY